MKKTILLVLVTIALAWPEASWGQSLDLAYHNVGLSLGNSNRFTGLRLNMSRILLDDA